MADKTLLDLPILASGDIDNSDVLHAIDISDNLDKQTTTGFLAEFILQRSAFNIETINTTPIWEQVKSDNIADGKRMFIETSTDRHRFGISNDAKTSSKYFLEVIRTGNTLTQTILRGDTVTLAGNTSVSGTLGTTGLATLNSASVTGALGIGGLLTVSSNGITSSSDSINLSKATEINAGTSSSVLKLISTDTFCFIDISDDTTTQPIAIGRSGNVLQLNPFSGTTLVGQTTDNGTDLLQVGAGSNISASIGELALFSDSGNAYISHYDKNGSTTDWGFRITGAYNTEFNAPSGSEIRFRNNNTEIATFSGSQIDFKQGVVIALGAVAGNPRLSFDQDLLSGNNFIQVDRDTGDFEVILNSVDVATFSETKVDLLKPVEALSGIKTDNARFKTKLIEIGGWDMDTTNDVSVAHGLSDVKKVKAICVMVRDDSSLSNSPLNSVVSNTGDVQGGITSINSTNVNLTRLAGGIFDNATYNSTTYNSTTFNRGWITITYEA